MRRTLALFLAPLIMAVAGLGLPGVATAAVPPETTAEVAGPGPFATDGSQVRITPPGADRPVVAVRPVDAAGAWAGGGGTAAVASEVPGQAFRVEAAPDGVAVTSVLARDPGPRGISFAIDLPEGSHLELQPDGSVAVVGGPATRGWRFAPPWARDASGRELATRYEVDGDLLVQHVTVDARTTYPVTADPKFTWGWVTGTVYFNRSETKKASTASGLIGVALGACAASLATGPFATIFCAGLAAHAGAIATVAAYAYGEGKCLKIKLPTFTPGTVKLGDGYCQK